MTLAAVVFDLDGLLVDSEPVQIAAWQAFLEPYGYALDQELLGRMFGLRVRDSSRLLAEELSLPLTPEEVFERREEIFFRLLGDAVQPMSGAQDVVRDLRARRVPLALATSGHRRYADTILSAIELRGAFVAEITGDDVLHGKPAPDIYLAAATALGVSPESCVALEDAPLGVGSAKTAGMTCLAVPNAHTAGLAGLEMADEILPSLTAVIPWLIERGLLRD